ncbi:uncharacterized protein LOC116062474 [Xyrichtys novacula]|uniref:Uncharacterized protein LOC116062474 n=1 Tax=Xyrichtys novacula TaxID=13765 RepID=A0AAV1FPB0_XYRNO|nr:uncharacterized protein LOC116062474 [Xyrichtys novacula]
MAEAPGDVQVQLKRDFLERLHYKVSRILQRPPLDVDYLRSVVNQEMAIFRSLLGQVERPQDVINTFTLLSTLLNIQDNTNQTQSQVPELQGLIEMSLPVSCIAGMVSFFHVLNVPYVNRIWQASRQLLK